jgi:hypothetical protein
MLLMVFAVMPAIYFVPGSDVGGKLENSLDSIELIKSSKPILILCICQACAMLMYNFAGMCVTDHLGAVFRTILETLVRLRCTISFDRTRQLLMHSSLRSWGAGVWTTAYLVRVDCRLLPLLLHDHRAGRGTQRVLAPAAHRLRHPCHRHARVRQGRRHRRRALGGRGRGTPNRMSTRVRVTELLQTERTLREEERLPTEYKRLRPDSQPHALTTGLSTRRRLRGTQRHRRSQATTPLMCLRYHRARGLPWRWHARRPWPSPL